MLLHFTDFSYNITFVYTLQYWDPMPKESFISAQLNPHLLDTVPRCLGNTKEQNT